MNANPEIDKPVAEAIIIRRSQNDPWILKALKSLGSLKFTVVLLALGLLLVWIASLQQTRMDIWEVKQQHFHSAWVYVPLETFLAPAWTSASLEEMFSSEFQGVKPGFPLPSGLTLMVLMLINLAAAHLFRFRVKGRGAELATGGIVFALGAVLIGMVVLNGQNAKGFQAQPVFSWQQLWWVIQFGLLVTLVSSVVGAVRLGRGHRVERVLLLIFAVFLAALVSFLFVMGERAFIGESAMRILWQLIQGGVGSLVMLIGCHYLFGRRSGIVLIHLGLVLLMLGEFYVTYAAKEQQMQFFEGETVSHTFDIRHFELAIISPAKSAEGAEVAAATGSTPLENVITIPGSRLQGTAPIDDPELPFIVKPLKYIRNHELVRLNPGESSLADKGIGLKYRAIENPINTGTSPDQVADLAAVYAQLIDRESQKPLGTYLFSQIAYSNDAVALDEVEVAGTTYRLGLRFEHSYKPYRVTLLDTTREDYPGTRIPKHFSSDLQIVYPGLGIDAHKKVWMNNPLRFGNETFYQQIHNADENGEMSGLQIVKNTGWMIPYVCCMMVGVGLLAQFGQTLLKFLKKNAAATGRPAIAIASLFGMTGAFLRARLAGQSGRQGALDAAAERRQRIRELYVQPEQYRERSWVWISISALLVLAIGYGFYTQSKPEVIQHDQMQLNLLGEVPIAYGGRVQPLDSLARNMVKDLTKSGSVKDDSGQSRPPIRWFADLIFTQDDFKDYYLFKVPLPDVQQALELERRKGHRYTYGEIEAASETIVEEARKARERAGNDMAELTNFERAMLDLLETLNKASSLQLAFSSPGDMSGPEAILRLREISLLKGAELPLIAGPGSTPDQWSTLRQVLAALHLYELADANQIRDISGLAQRVVANYVEKSGFLQERERQLVMERLVSIAESQDLELEIEDFRARLESRLADDLAANTPELQEMRDSIRPMLDAIAENEKQRLQPFVEQMLGQVLETDDELVNGIDVHPAIGQLSGIQNAYRDRDFEAFNNSLDSYLTTTYKNPPENYSAGRLRAESWLNRAQPFFLATVVYLLVFVLSVLGWIGWQKPISRIAFVLILAALAIHGSGLLARCYISGRPPITNLYSTALFIGLAMVVFFAFIEKLLGLGLGNLLAGVSGFINLMVAQNLSYDQLDTLSVLRAVLDTQFWLSTHVIIINLGYAATFVAGLLGIAWILGSLFLPLFTADVRKIVARMIYGITCFSLFFSFTGTVLGGLWADDSWGRFWGWDVKENGALMIVLVNAMLLHARWCGWVKERGIAALAVFGNIVVVWSWFAVNELNVGLHSYGGVAVDSGASIFQYRMFWIAVFWVSQLGVIGLAYLWPRNWWVSNSFDKLLESESVRMESGGG